MNIKSAAHDRSTAASSARGCADRSETVTTRMQRFSRATRSTWLIDEFTNDGGLVVGHVVEGPLMLIKDYLTITISLLALTISAAIGYFNIVRTKESISLISDTEPGLFIAKNGSLVTQSDSGWQVVFVNSGNRPAVISSVTLLYTQPVSGSGVSCNVEEGVAISTDLKSAVVKPGQS